MRWLKGPWVSETRNKDRVRSSTRSCCSFQGPGALRCQTRPFLCPLPLPASAVVASWDSSCMSPPPARLLLLQRHHSPDPRAAFTHQTLPRAWGRPLMKPRALHAQLQLLPHQALIMTPVPLNARSGPLNKLVFQPKCPLLSMAASDAPLSLTPGDLCQQSRAWNSLGKRTRAQQGPGLPLLQNRQRGSPWLDPEPTFSLCWLH